MDAEKLIKLINIDNAKAFWNEAVQQERKPFYNTSSSINQWPHCDLYCKNNLLFIEVEVPGINKNEIDTTFEKEFLVIKGNYQTLKPGVEYFQKERLNKSFERKIPIPVPILKNKMKISFHEGILTIKIPIEEPFSVEIPFDSKENSPTAEP